MNRKYPCCSPRRGFAPAISALCALSGVLWTNAAGADATVRLPGHVPAWTASAFKKGRVDANRALHLDLALAPRDLQGMKDLLHHLYTPGDPLYRHYLTPQQVADRFAPSQQQYDAVMHWAAAQGFKATPHANRLLVGLTAPASAAEHAFSLHLNTYLNTEKARLFAPDKEPAIPAEFSGLIRGVVGLHSSRKPGSNIKVVSPASPDFHLPGSRSLDGTGPFGLIAPADIIKAYKFDWITQNHKRLMGDGQTVALVEFDGFLTRDITLYRKMFSLGPANIVVKLVDGADGSVGSGQEECELDIDMVSAVAPNVKTLVYEAPNNPSTFDQFDANTLDLYAQIVDDNEAPVVSTSWFNGYETEPEFDVNFANELDLILLIGGLQGQTFFAASGDIGVYDRNLNVGVSYPSASAYVCSVGGTTLSLGPHSAYNGETSWNTFVHDASSLFGGGGGGGVSGLWTIPDWQKPFATFNSQQGGGASVTMRNIPDVALNASDASPYALLLFTNTPNRGWYGASGTSAAAPIWAGLAALVNQYRIPNGLGPIGYITPSLYDAAARYYLADYHDIHDGSTNGFNADTLSWLQTNFSITTGPGYPAIRYYDLSTGIGTPYAYSVYMELVNEGGSPGGVLDTPQINAFSGNHYVDLKWNAVNGASAYLLYRFDDTQALPTGVPYATVMGTSFTDTAVRNGVTYTYNIVATGQGGTSAYGAAFALPQPVRIVGGPALALPNSIFWSTSVLSDSTVTYGVDRNNLSLTVSDSTLVLDHSLALPNLVSGTTYYYRVWSNDGVTTTHSPPLSFVAP